MKKLFLVLAGLLVLALGLIIVLILRFDPEVLGERLIHEVNRQSGIRLQAEKFALHPLRGLELTNAQASGRVEAGDLSASIALLRLDYRVWPLLRGELWLDEVMLVEPRIELRSRSAEEVRQQKQRKQTKKERRGDRKSPGKERSGTSAEASEPPQGRPLELSIERLTVEDGMLAVRSEDGEQTRFLAADLRLILEGLSFEPEAASSIEAVSGRGKLATGRLVHGELEATKAGGRIEVAGGEVVLTEVNVQSANADLMIPRLRIRLTQEPPSYQLDAAGGLDLNGILGVDGGRDGFGPVAVDLAAEGEGPDLSEMIGAGTLSLRNVRLNLLIRSATTLWSFSRSMWTWASTCLSSGSTSLSWSKCEWVHSMCLISTSSRAASSRMIS